MKTIKMFGKFWILNFFLIGLFLPTISFARDREDRSIGVQVLYTALLGPGAEISYNLGDHLAFGVNYYAASYEEDGDEDNNETIEAEFSTAELFVRYFPFERSGFYIAGAAVSRDWKITGTGSKTDFGGSGQPLANYEITAEWPDTGFAYGIGGNWIFDFGLSWGLFLGALSGGEPELKGKVDNNLITQEQIDKEVDDFAEEENFGEKYKTAPLLRLNLGYNF
jgi:hypothetical protein